MERSRRIDPHTRLRFEIQMALNRRDPELAAAASALAFYGSEFFNSHAARVHEEIGRRAQRMRDGAYPIETVERQYRAGITYDVADRLRHIRAPTLVGVGTSDELAPPAYARAIAAAIEQSELIEFPGAPHMINMFAPDAFNEATLNFLRRHPAGGDGGHR